MPRPIVQTSTIMKTWFSFFWFSVSSIVVLWDAGFVLLRPRSLPGGDLHYIWKPYELYVQIDKQYGDMEDTFVIAQSLMNLAEVWLNLAVVALLLRQNIGALLLGFLVSSLTFWKTMIYMLQYTALCNGSHRLEHTTWSQLILLFLLPNGIWIICPLYFIVSYGRQLTSILAAHKEKEQ